MTHLEQDTQAAACHNVIQTDSAIRLSAKGGPKSERPVNQTPLLDFGSDLHLRMKFFLPASFSHPAKLHLGLLAWIVERYTHPGETILDPMAGSGSVLYAATMQRNVIARDIEPAWVTLLQQNARLIVAQAGLFAGSIDIGQADVREPLDIQVDHVIMSPPYGNEISTTANKKRALPARLRRMEDEHETNGVVLSPRWQRLLKVKGETPGTIGANAFHYGRHPAQIGHLRGARYFEAMRTIYTHGYQALRPGGFLILIVKDHIREGLRVPTAEQTMTLCQQLGFQLVARHQRRVYPLSLWQRRRKEAGLPVVEEEDILVLRKQQEQQ